MYDCIVVGGGTSGLMAAITASNKGKKKVLLLERNKGLGKKLLASGGGRCNITNMKLPRDLMRFINDKFFYKSLSKFGPSEIKNYFESNGLELVEEDENRMFPITGRAKDILDVLVKDLDDSNVDILYERVIDVNKDGYGFIVKTENDEHNTKTVIISTGGKSYPKLGSTGDGYQIAKKFGHKIVDPYPSNTPVISNDQFIKDSILQGISLKYVSCKLGKIKYSGPIIFTHFGLSGPCILNLSKDIYFALKKGQVQINIDFVPSIKREELTSMIKSTGSVKDALKEHLPKRVVDYIVNETDTDKNLSEISKNKFNSLIEYIKDFKVNISDVKGFDSAFVTGGGVSLMDIDPRTMESKLVYNMYFVGEVLDLDGKTGGYNHTIALSTGYTAGYNI